MTTENIPEKFWPTGKEKPSLIHWRRWRNTFTGIITISGMKDAGNPYWISKFRQCLGNDGQQEFDTLELDNKPTLDDVLDAFEQIWFMEQNVLEARYKFLNSKQLNNESIADFITRITNQIPQCQFSSIPTEKLELAMKIQCLISGVRDEDAREKLLSTPENKLTWEEAGKISRQYNKYGHDVLQKRSQDCPGEPLSDPSRDIVNHDKSDSGSSQIPEKEANQSPTASTVSLSGHSNNPDGNDNDKLSDDLTAEGFLARLRERKKKEG